MISKKNIRELVRYVLAAVSNCVIAYGIYSLSLLFFKALGLFSGYDYVVSQVIQFLISGFIAFILNRYFVFKLEKASRQPFFPSLLKSYATYAFTGLFLYTALLMFWVEVAGISEFLAPILNYMITGPVNYLINKLWVQSKK